MSVLSNLRWTATAANWITIGIVFVIGMLVGGLIW